MNEDDESRFADLVPGVRRLQSDRIGPYRHRDGRLASERRQRLEHEPRNLHSAALQGSGREAFFHAGLQKKLQRRIRQGQIRPEASLDLHGCRQQEALRLLDGFVEDSLRRSRRMVIVIHGRGLRSQQDAVLKPLVQRWLEGHQGVLAWCPAQPRDGGAGASYVYLRGN